VYTNNRQFRLLLNYKLSDKTQTALRLSSPPTLRSFIRSCITCIGPNVWRVPCESIPAPLRRRPTRASMHATMANVNWAAHRADVDSDLTVSIKKLMFEQGHPEGRLIQSSDGSSYRWEILGGLARPCLTAQIWRPALPEHKSNGARISVDKAGRVFLKCLHTQCRSVSGGQRCYVGMIPSSLLPHPDSSIPTNGRQYQRAARKRAAPHASAEHSQLRHPAGSWQGTGPPLAGKLSRR